MTSDPPIAGHIVDVDVAARLRSDDFTRSGVSGVVLDALLDAIHMGRLPQGVKISDLELAKELGVSRTPVREALQRMRELGLIEAAPHRYTRVVTMDSATMKSALQVWEGLYRVLLEEIIEQVPESTLEIMEGANHSFEEAVNTGNAQEAARQNFIFFEELVSLTTNPFLRKGIAGVVHVVRLGGLSLPQWIDTTTLNNAHHAFVAALRKRNIDEAVEAVHLAVSTGASAQPL